MSAAVTTPAAAMSHQIGSILHGYRIEAEIGRGDATVVHRATWIARQRVVALKLISPRPPTGRADLARAVRAAEAARAIDHPNIVPVHEAGEAGGVAFVAMRLIDGPSLATLLRAPGGVDPRRLDAILAQVGAALDHLASLGIVHGGVRPANILVGPGDHAYLTDVGMSGHGRDAAADRAALAAIAAAAASPRPRRRAPCRRPHPRRPLPRRRLRRPAARRRSARRPSRARAGACRRSWRRPWRRCWSWSAWWRSPPRTTGRAPSPPSCRTPPAAPRAPASPFPLGAVLPPALDGWRVTAGDPTSAERELHRLGRVETAHAVRGTATGRAGGRPARPRGRPRRARAGARHHRRTPRGRGAAAGGPRERRGPARRPLVAVSFADGGRVIVAVAPARDTALALAAAAGRAIP